MSQGGSKSNYRNQGVQQGGGSGSGSSNSSTGNPSPGYRHFSNKPEFERGYEGTNTPHYNQWNSSLGSASGKTQENGNEKSFYESWSTGSAAASQPFSNISPSIYDLNSQQQRFVSPYGNYDMDDSSFFAHTTRLNIVGPTANASTHMLRRRRSSSTERLLMNNGQRSSITTLFPQDFRGEGEGEVGEEEERSSSSPSSSSYSLSQPPPPAVIIKPTLFIPEKRPVPTDAYLKLSLQPSVPVEDPTTLRKLLVLDLNGTLLLRSAHSGRRAPPPPPHIYHSEDTASSTRTTSSVSYPYPALRTIYPRPYLRSFCAYLFHPTTLQWLDTMVWSSAQPHSVNDMVGKCFGTYRKYLKAVWARDTLGLSSDEYYKKTQTTKDLTKPWAQIPASITTNSNHIHPPQNATSQIEAPHGYNIHIPLQRHSALTTILMDDSPLKAILQPWNHLCVSEYGSERRKLDIEIAERDLEIKWFEEREQRGEESGMSSSETTVEQENETGDGGAAAAATVDDNVAMESTSEEVDKEAERRRKRKEKKQLKKEKRKLLSGKEMLLEARLVGGSYDETLLAVIGILDRLKHEGNVAGWMRSGGLLQVGEQAGTSDGRVTPSPSSEVEIETTTPTPTPTPTPTATPTATPRKTMTIPMPSSSSTLPTTPTAIPSSPLTPSTKRDGSYISNTTLEGPSKRRRLLDRDSSDTEMDHHHHHYHHPIGEREIDSDSGMTGKSSPSATSYFSVVRVEQAMTGVSLLSTGAEPTTGSSLKEEESSSSTTTTTTTTTQSQPLLWYETPSILSHWAERGRKALEELEIEIIAGVVPPSQNGGGQSSMGVRL